MKRNLLMVLALTAASAVHASLVVSDGFETGIFAGWTQFGTTGYAISGNAHSGIRAGEFLQMGSIGGIQQTLNVTPGQSYQITFWLFNTGGGGVEEFQLKWGGNTILDLVNPAAFGYTKFTQFVTGDGATDVLSFGFRQDPGFFLLDDVNVEPVPEPTTVIAGALLLLPLGIGAVRQFRLRARAV